MPLFVITVSFIARGHKTSFIFAKLSFIETKKDLISSLLSFISVCVEGRVSDCFNNSNNFAKKYVNIYTKTIILYHNLKSPKWVINCSYKSINFTFREGDTKWNESLRVAVSIILQCPLNKLQKRTGNHIHTRQHGECATK